MRYGSVCSGIEAATVAWQSLGWEPAFFSEIDKFPRAVLAHHYPDVPLHGDFTTIEADQYGAIDLLVGGTPCQSFSVAGLRGGLADDRGILALEFLRLADRARPRWLVWENVPGVLSSNGGRDFGSILGGLVELGYGFAYRVLDAQYFGVPQRRRRVFLVGYSGDWRPPAAVLLERHSLSWHSAPRREEGEVAPAIPSRNSAGGGFGTDFDCDGGLIPQAFGGGNCRGSIDVAACLTAKGQRQDFEVETFIAHTNADPIAFHPPQDPISSADVCHTIGTGSKGGQSSAAVVCRDVALAITSNYGKQCDNSNTALGPNVAIHRDQVRRLTPTECERLQGFPDDYTLVPYRGKPAADGPRYKALGNSMAVPVMRWIGERIEAVEAIVRDERRAA